VQNVVENTDRHDRINGSVAIPADSGHIGGGISS